MKIIKNLIIIISLIIVIVLYSRYYGTKGLKVNEYKVESTTITDEYHGLKIVHLSDLYYESIIFEKELINIVNKINMIKPDILVFTGDLVSQNIDKDILVNYLSKIKASLGKYYITGDNDLNSESETILNDSDFININDNYELIYYHSNQPIIISGISSEEKELSIKTENYDKYVSALPEEESPLYSILLIHKPDYIDQLSINNYDLILAGHSLGGKINLPLIQKLFLPDMSKKYYSGYYSIDNTNIYVNTGLGTDQYKFRLFNKPSINFYRLMKR